MPDNFFKIPVRKQHKSKSNHTEVIDDWNNSISFALKVAEGEKNV